MKSIELGKSIWTTLFEVQLFYWYVLASKSFDRSFSLVICFVNVSLFFFYIFDLV